MKHGKKYTEAAKAIDHSTLYDPEEAVKLVKAASTAKFDETIEVHIRTGCDGRHGLSMKPTPTMCSAYVSTEREKCRSQY